MLGIKLTFFFFCKRLLQLSLKQKLSSLYYVFSHLVLILFLNVVFSNVIQLYFIKSEKCFTKQMFSQTRQKIKCSGKRDDAE